MFIQFGIIAWSIISGTNGQQSCSTASGTQGLCISISDCEPLLKLLDQSSTSQGANTRTLRDSFCGLDGSTPKVCCPMEVQIESPDSSTFKPILDRVLSFVPDPPDVSNHPKLRLINEDICGPVSEPKVIGGNKTGVLEFPWMALIGYSYRRQVTVFLCGGTVINKRYVLTAAHCVTDLKPGYELSGVRLGDHDLLKDVDCDEEDGVPTVCADKFQNFFYEKVFLHSGFRPPRLDNDIALIRLDGDVDFTRPNVKPICLPIGDFAELTSDKAIVTGWGVTEKGYRSPDLLKVRLDIAPIDECARVWRESNNVEVTYKQFCAGGRNGKDSCGGDSGGPIQLPRIINDEPKYVQYGFVSFGTANCAVEGYPGVYTKITYYMDWILNTITW